MGFEEVEEEDIGELLDSFKEELCGWLRNLCPLTDVLFPAWESEDGKNKVRAKGMCPLVKQRL